MKNKLKIILISILITSCSPQIKYYLPVKKGRVLSGLEVFLKYYTKKYKGKKAIIVTNHSGVNFYLKNNISLLRQKGIRVIMAMAPEHGLYGYQNSYSKTDYFPEESNNLIVYNLHRLDKEKIKFLFSSADFVIFDIQDMGMRCYTYISNLKLVMDSLSGTKKQLLVFDRPNPISFIGVNGPFLEKRFTTKYISAFPATFIYNMTLGEAAKYYNQEFEKKVNLKVIKMKHYSKKMFYSDTGLPWVPPSPNLPTYNSAIIYAAVVLLEGTTISIGRGTTNPFEYIGAPWIKPVQFARELNSLKFKNFIFRPVYFKPTFNKFVGETCGGVQIFYTGGKINPTKFSYRLISFLFKKYPEIQWTKYKKWYDIDSLAGTNKFRKSINTKKSYKKFYSLIETKIKKFKKIKRRYELY